VFIVHETTSELETRDLVDPVIYQCRQHQHGFNHMRVGSGWLTWTPPWSTIDGGSISSTKIGDNGGGGGAQTNLTLLSSTLRRENEQMKNMSLVCSVRT
jgi:hypothetical protein